MYREQLTMAIQELASGEYDVGASPARCREDIDSVDSEWGIKSDETRGEMKVPLIDGEEWAKIRSYDSKNGNVGRRVDLTPETNGGVFRSSIEWI